MCGDGYVETSVWRQVCEDRWGQVCGDRCVGIGVWRQVCGDRCVGTGVKNAS